ncbi:hypothetical protein FGG08_005232 [Glutinoglossum americanum]|uniref:Uncharacterized protein n=1 Tax=Glutinoglossum americanum TaxID=1670608 RepID=A0A9P8I0R3_9PEZI|nr:hypothetical protein FGG08_005232 [Glutinoglossum americanum]
MGDVASDSTSSPCKMLAGNGHQTQQSAAETNYRSSSLSHSSTSTPTYPHPLPPSATAGTPTLATDPRASSGYDPQNFPQYPISYTLPPHPIPVPPVRANTHPFTYPQPSIRQPFPTQQHLPQHPHGIDPYIQSTPPYEGSSGYPPRGVISSNPTSAHTSPSHSIRSPVVNPIHSDPNCIHVRDLSHIQSFASEEFLLQSRSPPRRSRRGNSEAGLKYVISAMPVTDIIEMVAGLLTKITTTNDRQHEHLHRHIPPPDGTSGLSQQTTSVLAFHGKNVPSITILSYLSRIHKYCPTTYEVFLSLLVYFDRMTERVNSGPMQSLQQATQQPSMAPDGGRQRGSTELASDSRFAQAPAGWADASSPTTSTPPPSGSLGNQHGATIPSPIVPPQASPQSEADSYNISHFFVVDSFNIHRLVIAGVTCASKFFSDVGGLPLVELNHLELQFLLLNDFRLSVPVEELEAYGTMLVEFYAREVIAQRQVISSGHPMEGVIAQGVGGGIQTPTPP